MLITEVYDFDRNGHINFYASIDAQKVVNECTEHARRNHTTKPKTWLFVPTLTN